MATLAKRIDAWVGERIRARRAQVGLTQEQLAAALGISYQQVQKYETGANRVSAGRLYVIAQKLGVEIAHFFEGVAEDIEVTPVTPLVHGGVNRSTIEIARNFGDLADPTVRSALNGLVRTLVQKQR